MVILYVSDTRLVVRGVSLAPENRANEPYEISINGETSGRQELTMKDIHAQKESGSPLYRQYRGIALPVYEKPPGLAVLQRNRALNTWQVWLRMALVTVSDMLMLLFGSRATYVSVHERKADRRRWVMGLRLQTTNPADE
jgi:hypothetical protein